MLVSYHKKIRVIENRSLRKILPPTRPGCPKPQTTWPPASQEGCPSPLNHLLQRAGHPKLTFFCLSLQTHAPIFSQFYLIHLSLVNKSKGCSEGQIPKQIQFDLYLLKKKTELRENQIHSLLPVIHSLGNISTGIGLEGLQRSIFTFLLQF